MHFPLDVGEGQDGVHVFRGALAGNTLDLRLPLSCTDEPGRRVEPGVAAACAGACAVAVGDCGHRGSRRLRGCEVVGYAHNVMRVTSCRGVLVDFENADALNQAIRLLSLRHRARAAALLAPLGLHPGQEVLLLQLAQSGPMISAQLSEALGCEPPSVTLMSRKLEATGCIRRKPAPSDKRAGIVELTDRGKALAEQVKQMWCALAEETVAGLPAETVAELPGILNTLTGNVGTRRPRHPRGRRY